MRKPGKNKIFWGLPIAMFSVEVYLGVIFGYFLADFFSGKETGVPGKIKFNVFKIGKYKVHLHHWILSLAFLPLVVAYNISPLFSVQFTSGILGGALFQGIYCYRDWHNIIKRHEKIIE
ncbi:MAG: hypothetical protein PHW72_01390 [Candidatus Pacebacteria bacterium]|nr:hypothetical protein [Candidatus Paceibacterota bacterium]